MDMGTSHVTGRQRRYDSVLLLALSAVATSLVLPLHAGDEMSDAEVLDHLLQDSVVASIDVFHLNLGALGDEVHLSLTLFLLETKRDASDGSLLNSLHQVSGETSDFVSKSLGLDNSNIIKDSLVGVEVLGEPIYYKRDQLVYSNRNKSR